ncbi:hypothetical protein [Kaarinaea lacus]
MPDSADNFEKDKATRPWLSMLLEPYHIIDNGISVAIDREDIQGRKLACHKGCSTCC